MIPRIFVGSDKIKDDTVSIEGSDVNYLKNVLRLKAGDEISIINSGNREYSAKILSCEKDSIKAKFIAKKYPKSESKLKVAIAQGIPKNPKMDIIVQKATELGVIKVIPLKAKRSMVKIGPEKEGMRVARWQKIAKEAAEQSGRLVIPLVEEIMDFKEVLRLNKDFDKCMMLWEMEKEKTLKKFLQENKSMKSLLVLIGPEGGFSHDEVEMARKEGFVTVTIGSRILRTETAALAALSMINYEFEI